MKQECALSVAVRMYRNYVTAHVVALSVDLSGDIDINNTKLKAKK